MSITTHLQTNDQPGPTRPINGRALPGSRAVVGGLLVALAGLGLSRVAVRHLPASTLRPVILVVCSASALVLLVDTFV